NTGRRVDHIVPTGLGPEALRPIDETLERTIDVLGVGSLTAIKDFESFFEIVSELRRVYPTLQCTIIGEGPQRAELEKYIAEHGLHQTMRLAGRLPRHAVLETMRNAKILLHTARYEGQGYVILEALAAGTRVVCRDVGYTGNGVGVYRCKSNAEML